MNIRACSEKRIASNWIIDFTLALVAAKVYEAYQEEEIKKANILP